MKALLAALLLAAGLLCPCAEAQQDEAKQKQFLEDKANAEKGDAAAQYFLGLDYYFGKGVEKDQVEGVKWFRKAAEQGHADAQSNVGIAYHLGIGVPKDYVEAVKWCRKAGAQGKYSVAGQMLPEDLSLVKDDVAAKDTRLERLFARNVVLPTKTKKTVEVGRTITKGSADELRIIVVEGSADNHSSTNKPIGHLIISGQQLSRDLLKGTEVDLTFEMSESRDMTVSAFVNGTGQAFSQVFDPKPRAVPVQTLASEIQLLESRLEDETAEAEEGENFETVEGLSKLKGKIEELVGEATLLSIDDVTDDRFKLEDKKRRFAQEMFQLTAGKKIEKAKGEYQVTKLEVSDLVSNSGNDKERNQLTELLAREHTFVSSNNPAKIEAATQALERIRWQILSRTPDYLIGMFQHVVGRRASMNDELQAKNLIESGKRHIASEAWDQLREVNIRLLDLLPQSQQKAEEFRHFTGIV